MWLWTATRGFLGPGSWCCWLDGHCHALALLLAEGYMSVGRRLVEPATAIDTLHVVGVERRRRWWRQGPAAVDSPLRLARILQGRHQFGMSLSPVIWRHRNRFKTPRGLVVLHFGALESLPRRVERNAPPVRRCLRTADDQVALEDVGSEGPLAVGARR